MTFEISAGHIITIVSVVTGYLIASLIAWGKLTADVGNMKESQAKLVNQSDLKAAVSEMTSELYKAIGCTRTTAKGRKNIGG